MIIDIHNHTLYGVDDGPETIEESIEMLQAAKVQGVEAIILTPHYRHGMFPYIKEQVESHFTKLKAEADKIGIKLFLGCEYHMNGQVAEAFSEGRCHSLADSDYVLTEYKYEADYSYIEKQTYHMISYGYIPVIAHAERYNCLTKKPELCEKLSRMGALIQINADSVLGLDGFFKKQCCKKLLKNGWVDIIASDTHDCKERASHMGQCYEHVQKKYDTEYADKLFYKNPKKIIS